LFDNSLTFLVFTIPFLFVALLSWQNKPAANKRFGNSVAWRIKHQQL
jgi:uncharacterized membrane protein